MSPLRCDQGGRHNSSFKSKHSGNVIIGQFFGMASLTFETYFTVTLSISVIDYFRTMSGAKSFGINSITTFGRAVFPKSSILKNLRAVFA